MKCKYGVMIKGSSISTSPNRDARASAKFRNVHGTFVLINHIGRTECCGQKSARTSQLNAASLTLLPTYYMPQSKREIWIDRTINADDARVSGPLNFCGHDRMRSVCHTRPDNDK